MSDGWHDGSAAGPRNATGAAAPASWLGDAMAPGPSSWRPMDNASTVDTAPPPVNRAPTAEPDEFAMLDDATLDENLTVNDPDDDALTYQLVEEPFAGSLELRADGSFSYSPETDVEDVDRFVFVASDGFERSARAEVVVNVLPRVNARGREVDEAQGSLTVEVVLGRPASAQVVVDVRAVEAADGATATPGVDFAPLDTELRFDPGKTEQQLIIERLDDEEVEAPEEEFILRLTVKLDGTSDPHEATMTIIDNDRDVDDPDGTVPEITGSEFLDDTDREVLAVDSSTTVFSEP